MKKILLMTLLFISMSSNAESIVCQIAREQLIKEISENNKRPTFKQQQDEALAIARLAPEELFLYNSHRSAQNLGNIFRGALNNEPSLAERLGKYIEKCEK